MLYHKLYIILSLIISLSLIQSCMGHKITIYTFLYYILILSCCGVFQQVKKHIHEKMYKNLGIL